MALFAGCKTSNEPKAPVALTWEMGASDIEPGYYENTFILKNISQKPLKKNWTIYYSQLPRGVKANAKGYQESQLTGEYEFVVHDPTTFFQGSNGTAKDGKYPYKGVDEPITIKLESGGKVSGDKTGTWSFNKDSNQMTITIDGTEYQGDFAQLPRETDLKSVMTFTAIGGNTCVWGSQV